MKTGSIVKNLSLSVTIQLSLVYSLILLAGLMALSGSIAYRQTELLEKQAAQLGIAFISQAADTLKTPLLADSKTGIGSVASKLREEKSVIGINIYDKEYTLVHTDGFTPKDVKFPAEGNPYTQHVEVLNDTLIDIERTISYTVEIKYDTLLLGYLSVSFEQAVLGESRKEILKLMVLVAVPLLLFCIVTAMYLGKQLTRPLNDLMSASTAISKSHSGLDASKISEDRDEFDVLMDSLSSMNKGLLQKDRVEAVFSRYVSAQVAQEVLKDLDSVEEVELGGEHLTASVFFADIVGFTSLSETMEPQEISDLLNVYFSKVTEVVSFCKGHVDKFIGDCAMVVFGVPVKNERHAFDCIACAWMVLQLLNELNRRRELEGKMRVEFRIGANSGMMLAGNMGSSERMEYTVVGDAVNLASRLCGTAEPGELIITEDVFVEEGLEGVVLTEDKDFIRLRGKKLPVKTLVVADILTPFKQQMLDEIPLIIERCENAEEQ